MSCNEDETGLSKTRTLALYIPALDIGGAERQLLEFAKGLNKARWNVLILTNFINPLLSLEINNTVGINVVLLKRGNRILYPFRLHAILCREKPHVIYTFLMSAQLYTLLICPFLRKIKIVFSIRDAVDYAVYHGIKGKCFKMLLKKSLPHVDYFIFNSVAGRKERPFLSDEKIRVIPNGIDTERFHPNAASRKFLIQETSIDIDAPIVGMVGNLSIYKGYDIFIQSARIISSRMPGVRFVSIGNCETSLGKKMRDYVAELGLDSTFHFLGTRSDVHQLLPGLDVFVSASLTEGFCNAICEGMACGIPCVVTDVGDSAMIVGNTGIVVPPAEPELLAEGIMQLLELSLEKRLCLGESARARIVENFSVTRMVTETENVFERLLCDGD